MDNQLNLFDVKHYGGKKLRGPYNIKHKVKELSDYELLSSLLGQIANFLPCPIFQDQEEFNFPYIKLWNSKYTFQPYEYQHQTFDGEDFSIIEAELVGTELFSIQDRINLHQMLLEKVKSGVNIKIVAEQMQPLIEYMKERDKPKQGDLYVWLKKQLRG